ncbi:UNVERIFIED_CONTAM: hypothetical protein GTU68_013465, partial [Idotea baltica]|nr:hypothetical protein [Idotea baltica]
MDLLRQYGPDVPEAVMRQLVGAFSELRELADQGLIQYPYSTREVVNIVKHLQKYDDDGIASVVRNVFDFDTWSGEAKQMVVKVMHKYGIPIGASAANVNLAKRFPLPEPIIASSWRITQQKPQAKTQLMQLPVETSAMKFKGPINVYVNEDFLEPSETRSAVFSEQESFWALPFYETALASGITSTVDGDNNIGVHVVTLSPFALYSLYPKFGPSSLRYMLLHDIVPIRRGASSIPRINVAPLPKDHLAIHEESTNTMLIVHPASGQLWNIRLDSLIESATSTLKQSFMDLRANEESFFRMEKALTPDGLIVLWEFGGSRIRMLDIVSKNIYSSSLPLNLASVNPLSRTEILLEDETGNKFVFRGKNSSFPSVLHPLKEKFEGKPEIGISVTGASGPLSDFTLSAALRQKISAPSTMLSPVKDLAAIAVGFPELDTSENEVYLWKRNDTVDVISPRLNDPSNLVSVLPEAGQVVRLIENLPSNIRKELDAPTKTCHLEITDLISKGLFYLPVPRSNTSPMWNFLARERASSILMSPVGKDGV